MITTIAENGLEVVFILSGFIYSEGMSDMCSFDILGEPDTSFSLIKPAIAELTCALMINRIP